MKPDISRRRALATIGAGAVPTLPLDKRRLPGVLQEAGTLGKVLVPRSMVAGYTDPYLIKVDGDCLSPGVNDGDSVVASPDAPVIRGKFVVLYPKDGGKPSVKRAIMIPPPDMMESHPDSEIMPLAIVETLNPPRCYQVTVDKLEAVHGVLGVIPRDPGGAFLKRRPGARHDRPGRPRNRPSADCRVGGRVRGRRRNVAPGSGAARDHRHPGRPRGRGRGRRARRCAGDR